MITFVGRARVRCRPGVIAVHGTWVSLVATLTLLAGAMFLVVGGVRIVLAIQVPGHRILLAISGLVSLVMGLVVLLNFTAAALTLLGILLGIQMLSEGIVLLLAGPLAPRGTGGRAATGTPVGPGATSGT